MSRLSPDDRRRMIQQAVQVANYGYLPAGPVTGTPGPGSSPADTDPDLFTADDLLQPQARSRQFTMPGGKRLWVHALSWEEVAWLNAQAAKEVRGLPATDEVERELERRQRAEAYQVVMACRVGPEAGAKRVFEPKHAEALRKNLPLETVQRICRLSDELGAADTDQSQWEVIRDFFGHVERCAETWRSQLSADCPSCSSLVARLEAFGSCASRIARLKSLTASDVAVVRQLAEE